jgi:hypothetical protein
MTINLFRGPEHIFTGRPIAIPTGNGETPTHASGQIKLPDFLPAGDYALELIVRDRGNPASPSAAQWTDFTLVK